MPSEQKPRRRGNPSTLSWRDEEDLRSYAEQLRDLSIHANGMELGSTGGEPPTTPKWLTSFSARSDSALMRGIHLRLTAASNFYSPAATILLALHDPAALLCDGKTSLTEEELARAKEDPTFRVRERLDVGRRLAVYPCTWTADEARRWRDAALGRRACDGLAKGLLALTAGTRKGGRQKIHPLERIGEFVCLDGRRPVDLFARMVDAKRSARGEAAEVWRQIDAEAVALVEGSIRAWNGATDDEGQPVDHRANATRPNTGRISEAA